MFTDSDTHVPRGSRVLIAIERPEIRRSLATELTKEGHEVSVVGSGRQLLGLLRAAVMQLQDLQHDAIPDVIVTDMRMSKSAGVDALETVRNIRPHRVRVVLLADFGSEIARRYARWHDAFVVDEPHDIELLQGAVNEALAPEWDPLFEDDDDFDHDGYSSIRPRHQGTSRGARS